jgi:DNA-binding GntR family transcriptional regulator
MSASERAYRYVKEQILDGVLGGGELISEGEVAEAVGMSRTPVRAAFVQLEAEGLLRLYPKRGALVVPVSAREAESVMETRWVIERYAIERSTPELGAQLSAAADAHEGLEGGEFVEADRAFHRLLVADTGNDILLSLYDSLRDRQRRMGRVSTRTAARKASIVAEHHELATAISAGDTEAALAILQRHLDGALAALRGR